ncbi:MAG: hypothetical protein GEU79_02055 [Acidimicrobiia bacterium]|nr:hypothetical protein [Acidimicrobiia bacterium]
MTRPISFLSDFGLRDEFVGVVHGVLATLAPDSRVIDITHGVDRGNLRGGALTLTRAVQYLPEDGIVLAVVDPGVGTSRRALAAETGRGFFIGPDNGLLSPAVAMVGGAHRIHSIENPDARISSPGDTFAGRDIFAPAAALLATGEMELADLGPEVDPDTVSPMLLPFPEVKDGKLHGEVWWVDGFGNAQTNLDPEALIEVGCSVGDRLTVRTGATERNLLWVTTYADVEPGAPLIHVDSSGLLAIAIREGDVAHEWGLSLGRTVVTGKADQ